MPCRSAPPAPAPCLHAKSTGSCLPCCLCLLCHNTAWPPLPMAQTRLQESLLPAPVGLRSPRNCWMLRNLSCCFGEHLEGDDSAVTLKRSPLPRTSETIQRPSSGCQYFPIPTARPKASQLSHASYHARAALAPAAPGNAVCNTTTPPPHMLGWTDQSGHTHKKKRRALVLHRLLLRGMKKVLYVARTPTQLGLQPATAWPALVPTGLLASTVTGGRGSIPQSSGTSPALLGAGTDGISLRMGCSGGRGSFWGRRMTKHCCYLG